MIGTVRHGDRDTVARTGCPMYRDVTPHERPHNNTAPFSAGSNDLVVSAMRVLTRRRHWPSLTWTDPRPPGGPPIPTLLTRSTPDLWIRTR